MSGIAKQIMHIYKDRLLHLDAPHFTTSSKPDKIVEGVTVQLPQSDGNWEDFCPCQYNRTSNDQFLVGNESVDKTLWINTKPFDNVLDKIHIDILVIENNKMKITNVSITNLTIKELEQFYQHIQKLE